MILAEADRPEVVQRFLHRGRHHERVLRLPVAPDAVERLATAGFLHIPGYLDEDSAADLAALLQRWSDDEQEEPDTHGHRGTYYVRHLLSKDARFAGFLTDGILVPIARALLGPQVRATLDARVVAPGVDGAGVDWHVHMPGALAPIPPWYSAPHNLNCLIYLDPVTSSEGGIGLAEGSHTLTGVTAPEPEELRRCEVILHPDRGDLLVSHGNLWHRTVPAAPDSGPRRVLFVAFTAAWVEADARITGQPAFDPLESPPLLHDVRHLLGADEIEELTGGFRW